MDEHLLTLEEAASYLRCRPSTLYGWVASKQIPVVKLREGKRKPTLRFTKNLLQEHVRRNTIPAAELKKAS